MKIGLIRSKKNQWEIEMEVKLQEISFIVLHSFKTDDFIFKMKKNKRRFMKLSNELIKFDLNKFKKIFILFYF